MNYENYMLMNPPVDLDLNQFYAKKYEQNLLL
jgi:hypothetical protein